MTILKKLTLGVTLLAATACAKGPGTPAAAATPDAQDIQKKGNSLVCASSGKNAWLTYGANAFVAVNKSIIANVGTEMNKNGTKDLGDSFTKIGTGNPVSTTDKADVFEGKLAAFLVYAYGGPTSIKYTDGKTYRGPQNMGRAHKGLGITSSQYDFFVAHIVVPALTTNKVPATDIASCFAPVLADAGFKNSIVGQ